MLLLALTSTRHSIPSLQKLHPEGHLAGIIVPDRQSEDIHQLRHWADQKGIAFTVCNRVQLEQLLIETLSVVAYDAVIVYGFPWKIPASVLSLPAQGFFNIHFSLLPAYRGPAPVFWQLSQNESTTGVTVHRVDPNFDTGEIVGSVAVPIIPGENEGYCSARLAQLAVGLINDLVTALAKEELTSKPQNESMASYYGRPTTADIAIDWNKHTSQQLQNMVNACNPIWQGALCMLNGQPVRILEVSPAEAPDYPGQKAGAVIHADAQAGIFVICCDRQVLRLNILHTQEGIFSGGKLAAMGITMGSHFGNAAPKQSKKTQLFNINLQT